MSVEGRNSDFLQEATEITEMNKKICFLCYLL